MLFDIIIILIHKGECRFENKRIMKQILPEGFFQKRTVTLNYASIRHMAASRSHHQLTEWNTDFIYRGVKWINSINILEIF